MRDTKKTQMYTTVFWTLWERARAGWFGRIALKHVNYHMWNESPVQVWCMTQDARGWCTGSSQFTSPKHPVSCIEPGLQICFTYDNIHVSMLFSEIIPPSPSPTESKRLFYTSVSLLLSRIQGYRYHLSKFHIYAWRKLSTEELMLLNCGVGDH